MLTKRTAVLCVSGALIWGLLLTASPHAQDLSAPVRGEPGATEPVDRPEERLNESQPPGDYQASMCLMIESAARSNALPFAFFARLIWQESSFRANAIGPRTRSGERAQGIAQFMPATAAERGLLDPFDPVQALPKSAEFLRELREQFGNLGLAAAAYNAGPSRVRDWLNGAGGMPQETRNYVLAITGRTIEDWIAFKPEQAKVGENGTEKGCSELMALLKRAPTRFFNELEERVKVASSAAWGVQLAGGFSRSKALAAYARASSRLASILRNRDPTILSSILRSRGTRAFYQVRVGVNTRAEGEQLCSRIKRAGGVCVVLRNGFNPRRLAALG